MPEIEISSLALDDLKSISRYTLRTWDEEQAVRYINEIEECIRQIAKSPSMGCPCASIKKGCRCIQQGRHVIFYRQSSVKIKIIRILHQRMLSKKHITY